MMNKKAILLPIQPQWCELIAAGKKKYELRKNAPKCDFPVTVYIYQSKHRWKYSIYDAIADLQGKVIGKFTLNETVYISGFDIGWMGRGMSAVPGVYALVHSCVPQEDVRKYQGSSVYLFAWKIDDLVIFEKPMNLSDFYTDCCDYLDENQCCRNTECCAYREYCDAGDYSPCVKEVKSAPQNYCFVEEIV